MSPGLAGSSIVWFREGFEIYLILQMAFLLIQNNKQKIALSFSTFLGILSATFMGIIAKEFVEKDFAFIEATTAIIESLLLYWTAWYCHGAQKNAALIKENLKNNGSILALSIVVFLTVFREGAEIVVFLTGLYVAGSSLLDLGFGAILGLGLLIIIAFFASRKLKKLPVAKVFASSKWAFTILATYFLYYGIHELLE
ncbi:MAG: FTR1 family protein [Pseudomonadota bacterium]|nr:FTR1 family protein [Pseudomonadota bacterium]